MKLTWQPLRPEPAEDPDVSTLGQALARIARLEAELLVMSRLEATTRQQRDLLAVRIAAQGAAPEDFVRARKTLLRCEDMLAACRDQHGTNSRTGAPVVLG